MPDPALQSSATRHRAPEAFAERFGTAPSVRADAPGRVNLIGEHTDYNGGFVLPTAIPQRAAVYLAPRRDRTVRAASLDADDDGAVHTYVLGEETPGRGWLDYVQGATRLLQEVQGEDGAALSGFDALIAADVPIGSGLSSSAALLVALLRALRDAFGLALDDVALARLAQRVENDFVGVRVGVMDPMAASLADSDAALFLDTRSLAFRRVPLPREAFELAVVDSGVAHRHAGGGYNARRAECEEAAQRLGVAQLRDLAPGDLDRAMALPEPLGRRVRHVVTENARVLNAVAAIETHDAAALGALFDASHASMRDDYEVSTPDVDRLVGLAQAAPEVFGARLTGGGFGGAVIALCRPGTAAAVAARVAAAYTEQTDRAATVLVPPSEAPAPLPAWPDDALHSPASDDA